MKIFLAASTSGMTSKDRTYAIQKFKPKYLLESFYAGEKACIKALNDVGADNFLLDSGAFSYLNGAKATINEMNKYIERYIQFINTYNIKYYFELDVDVIFGIEIVEKWRHLLENRTGTKSIPVWHKERGVEYWKRMCQEYDYIAIGGLVTNVKKQEFDGIRKLVHYAYNLGVRVHGLGFTKTKELRHYKFYSVDSSSWLAGSVRGQQMYHFKNGELSQHQIKTKERLNLSLLAAHNFGEWVKYQKFMEGIRI